MQASIAVFILFIIPTTPPAFIMNSASSTAFQAAANANIVTTIASNGPWLLLIQVDIPSRAAARSFKISTIIPPVHSATGSRKLSHAQSHNGFSASNALLNTSSPADKTSKKAGNASSIVHVANGTNIFVQAHSKPENNFSVSGCADSFKLSSDVIRLSNDIDLSGSNAFLTLDAIFDIALDTFVVSAVTPVSIPRPPEDVLSPPELLLSVGSESFSIWSNPASDFSISFAVEDAASPIPLTLSAVSDAISPRPVIEEAEEDISAPVSICVNVANPSATFCKPASTVFKPRNIGVNNAIKPLPREAFNCSNLSDNILV